MTFSAAPPLPLPIAVRLSRNSFPCPHIVHLSIGHVSPEAAVGGPIALVEEGDMIEIDINNLSIKLDVSDEELAKRKAAWKPRQPKVTTGYLARYAAMVTSGNRGAVLEVPKN